MLLSANCEQHLYYCILIFKNVMPFKIQEHHSLCAKRWLNHNIKDNVLWPDERVSYSVTSKPNLLLWWHIHHLNRSFQIHATDFTSSSYQTATRRRRKMERTKRRKLLRSSNEERPMWQATGSHSEAQKPPAAKKDKQTDNRLDPGKPGRQTNIFKCVCPSSEVNCPEMLERSGLLKTFLTDQHMQQEASDALQELTNTTEHSHDEDIFSETLFFKWEHHRNTKGGIGSSGQFFSRIQGVMEKVLGTHFWINVNLSCLFYVN